MAVPAVSYDKMIIRKVIRRIPLPSRKKTLSKILLFAALFVCLFRRFLQLSCLFKFRENRRKSPEKSAMGATIDHLCRCADSVSGDADGFGSFDRLYGAAQLSAQEPVPM